MITQETIQQVLEIARIEEIVGDFVTLKKAGQNYKGLSPFSAEKTPSFMVSPAKGIFKDFSSGKGGDVIRFLMEMEKMNYPEAIKFLAKRYNIPVVETQQSEEEIQKKNKREELFLLNNAIKKYYHKNLLETTEGQNIGLTYFKQRGFSTKTIEEFGLGYSFSNKTETEKYLRKNQYNIELAKELGILVDRGSYLADKYAGRVMFPIFNNTGRVLGFGARILGNNDKTAKYLNSPQSEIYHKSQILYGLFQAKKTIAKEQNCFLVEGYTDVISLYQAGVKNVVATSGTALTQEQARSIRKFTEKVTLVFDGDAAGIRAATKGVGILLGADLNVNLVPLPEGQDPDSLAQSMTTEELSRYLTEKSEDFLLYKIKYTPKKVMDSPAEKTKLIEELVEAISQIGDPIKREVYVEQCASLLSVSIDAIQSVIHKHKTKPKPRQRQTTQDSTSQTAPPIPKLEAIPTVLQEQVLLEYLINQPQEKICLFGIYPLLEKESSVRLIIHFEEEETILESTKKFFEKTELPYFENPLIPTLLTTEWDEQGNPNLNSEDKQAFANFLKLDEPEIEKRQLTRDLIAVLYGLRIQICNKQVVDLTEKLNPAEEVQQEKILLEIQEILTHRNMLASDIFERVL